MPKRYTVKQGDDLLKLAKKFGLSTSALLAANAGVSSITPGVTLRIPGTTQLSGVDPKGPWTPDLPQPDPKDPYVPLPVPPKPDLPDWFPEKREPEPPGPVDPKGPWTPDLPQPPPVQPLPVQPLPQQPTYLPPAVSMAQLEASRVPQQPVVALTGAQRPPPQRPFGVGTGAGIVGPATLGAIEQFRQTVVPVVQTYLNRLFGRGTTQTPVVSYTGAQQREQFARRPGEPTAGARWPVQRPAEPVAPTAARGEFYAETVRIAEQLGVSPTEAAEILAQQGTFAPPTVGTIGAQGFPEFETGERVERSSILEWYLERGRLPIILFEEDIARMGWTDAELAAAGYIRDQFGDWVLGGMEPGAAEEVAAGVGGSGGYYPRGGGGGGGRGGGAYSYPSYLPRAAAQYPQSFVQRGQRGVTPTGRTTRAARMGVVSWRI